MNITGSLTNKDPRRGHVVIINQSTSSNVASGFPYRRSYVIHHWCNVCLRGSNLIHYGMLQRGRTGKNLILMLAKYQAHTCLNQTEFS